ncbi:MAG: hypothetical protein KDI44_16925 [Thiothrix sp.]|nr:hypothetical protein [Thiothrix sp.]
MLKKVVITVFMPLFLFAGCMANTSSSNEADPTVGDNGISTYTGTYTRRVAGGGFVDGKTGLLWRLSFSTHNLKKESQFSKLLDTIQQDAIAGGNEDTSNIFYAQLKGKLEPYANPNPDHQIGTIWISDYTEVRRPYSFVPSNCNMRLKPQVLCSSEGMAPYRLSQ